MAEQIKKISCGLLVFLIVPLFAILIGWSWQPTMLNAYSQPLFWITQSAGLPWAVLASIVLFILFCIMFGRQSLRTYFKLGVILCGTLLAGQVIKSVVKNQVQEARPFVLWLEDQYQIDDRQFYALPRSERADLVKQKIQNNVSVPGWLASHWQAETGYAFPSGHTLFAVTWAFLALLLIQRKRYFPVVIAIVAWAVLIEISRLLLGMHYPTDLIWGSIISLLLSLIGYVCAKKWHIVE